MFRLDESVLLQLLPLDNDAATMTTMEYLDVDRF